MQLAVLAWAAMGKDLAMANQLWGTPAKGSPERHNEFLAIFIKSTSF
jgi:hypothetical protein